MSRADLDAERAKFVSAMQERFGDDENFECNEDESFKIDSWRDAFIGWQAALASQVPKPGDEPPVWKALQALANPYTAKDGDKSYVSAHAWDQAIIIAMRIVLTTPAMQPAPRVPTDEMCIAAREKFGIGANYAQHVYEHMAAQAPAVRPVALLDDQILSFAEMHLSLVFEPQEVIQFARDIESHTPAIGSAPSLQEDAEDVLPKYEADFRKKITDLVMRHIDRMNDICEQDTAEKIIGSFEIQFRPIFDAYMEIKFPYRTGIYAARKACDCQTCRPITLEDNRMVLCSICGNKRCPHANDHRNACTNSNEPGQKGSAYE